MSRIVCISALVLAASASAGFAGPVVILNQLRSVEAVANVELNGVIDAPTDSQYAPDANPRSACRAN